MQINAFGFPLGTNTGVGTPAGAPALGFLQALGAAGAGQPVGPSGGLAIAPATSLGDMGQTIGLTAGTVPGTGVGNAPLANAAFSASGAPTPLLPQGNDALAHLTTPSATPNAPALAADMADVTILPAAQPSPEKPILASLQTTTSLSGLLATAVRPAAEAPAAPAAPLAAGIAAPAIPVSAQPLGKPINPEAAVAQMPAQPALIEGGTVAAEPQPVVSGDTAPPIKGKPAKPADQEADPAPEATPQPLIAAPLAAQPAPQQAAAQPVAPQTQAETQLQANGRQPRAAGVQPATPEAPVRATRKSGAEPAQLGATAQAQTGDAVGVDFARAVQAAGGDNGASAHDGGQPHDQQVKVEGTFASVSQPTHSVPPSGSAAAAPAAPLAQEPIVATRPGQFGHAMGVEIARKVEAGEETLRIRLSPDNLGRVEVTLAFEDGNLKATVRAESQRALDLLRQDMPDLARTLDQAGVRTDAQSFRFETRADTGGGQQQGGNQQQRGQNPQQQHAQADDLEPAPAYRAIRADGQVDLLA